MSLSFHSSPPCFNCFQPFILWRPLVAQLFHLHQIFSTLIPSFPSLWKWKLLSHVRLFATPCPRKSPGQNIGVGSLSPFQGIFPTQGLNPGLPHCRWIFYQLSHKGNPFPSLSSLDIMVHLLNWSTYDSTFDPLVSLPFPTTGKILLPHHSGNWL